MQITAISGTTLTVETGGFCYTVDLRRCSYQPNPDGTTNTGSLQTPPLLSTTGGPAVDGIVLPITGDLAAQRVIARFEVASTAQPDLPSAASAVAARAVAHGGKAEVTTGNV